MCTYADEINSIIKKLIQCFEYFIPNIIVLIKLLNYKGSYYSLFNIIMYYSNIINNSIQILNTL